MDYAALLPMHIGVIPLRPTIGCKIFRQMLARWNAEKNGLKRKNCSRADALQLLICIR